ncbi:DM13 domain-containing protein [Dolichospermum sp. UHCC 0259]|uniref:DM13 domain-containing protein n=1 Tax=Dolichospermum sp. UHCC 0259 TaxID=2590010 RepID=UPI001445F567|nr:DM13 domain-containing protein [Dolichospermum sp. UHCC 0259]MTJ49566.1 DM13 domain-containing protein [Dolichospermum sp. UHCC 0259]
MKLSHLLTLSLSSFVIFSCVQEGSNNQSNANPLASNTSIRNSSIQTDSLAQSEKSQDAKVISSGAFVSGEHTTQGAVSIMTKNGKSFLELNQSFKTSKSGPDLVVILHRSNDVINSTKPPAYPLKRGDYFVLAPLKKYSGSQVYSIPDTIKLTDYKSVGIWCRKFNATFGAASTLRRK